MGIIPFTAEIYYRLLDRIASELGLAAFVSLLLAVLVLALMAKPSPAAGRLIAGALAILWAWCGAVFQWQYFSALFWPAPLFAALFALQAGLLIWLGAVQGVLSFGYGTGLRGRTGTGLALAGIVLFPAIGSLAGFYAPLAGLPGLTPGATVLFTLGLLMLSRNRPPRVLYAVPLIWAVLAAITGGFLGMWEQLALPVAALLAAALPRKDRSSTESQSPGH